MALYARVAVSAASFAIDKYYDYLIPDELIDKAVPGVRILVPFSRNNKRAEGIITALSNESDYSKHKYLQYVIDEEPIISESQLKLARWMKNRFFCTIYEAVKTMLPASLWFKTEDYCIIKEGLEKDDAFAKTGDSEDERTIVAMLFELDGLISVKEAGEVFGERAEGLLKTLQKAGVVELHTEVKRNAKEKTVNTAELVISPEEAVGIAANKRGKSSRQAEVLKLLSVHGEASVKDISYFTGAGLGSIKALEKSGYIRLQRREIFRKPEFTNSGGMLIEELNKAQLETYEGLKKLLGDEAPHAALLHGVTGSGKTAVYIKLISDTISRGKRAIVLVPEIALTPQLMHTFTRHFGEKVAVLHSSLTAGERFDEWRRIKTGLVDLVVGTRSAIFAPVENLGLVIIDEEQETAYKSESGPRYHARDIAKYLCVENNALLLMGSATPAIESMYGAKTGKYSLFRMETRYNELNLPEVIIADMKKELREGSGGTISSLLKKELERNILDGRQSILFLNRRGTNSIITCPECGHIYSCPQCSVNLTYHRVNQRMMCHYCGHSEIAGEKCPSCKGKLKYVGYGTQKVEDEVKKLFDGVEVVRMDFDTISATNSHDSLMNKFVKKNIPVLVGTQMVTKGLNFENVTLVGVISADQSLYASDYRAQERTFSLITQVVGRSGRGSKAGRAVIQTFTPENEIIKLAASQDYNAFYDREIAVRKILGSPPVAELYCLTASGYDEQLVLLCCYEMKSALEASLFGAPGIKVLGPAPAFVVKIKNRFRYRVFISSKPDARIRSLIAGAIRKFSSDKRFKGVSVFGDINPNQ